MRKFFAVAMGSVVALVGFAGAANASATVDLIWIDVSNLDTQDRVICLKAFNRNCPRLGSTISNVDVSDTITLGVIVTAGPGSLLAAGVSVNFGDAVPKLGVSTFQAMTTTRPLAYLPTVITTPIGPNLDSSPPWVSFINAGSFPNAGVGIGLTAGATAYLGTVTFHKDALINGTFDIHVGTDGPDGVDGVIKLDGIDISAITTYNGATVVNVPEPGALSLLVMGLGGMLLAGRGRRS